MPRRAMRAFMPGNLPGTVRRYNGSGAKVQAYADDVMRRPAWIKAG